MNLPGRLGVCLSQSAPERLDIQWSDTRTRRRDREMRERDRGNTYYFPAATACVRA
jgi:hypothetical protein